MRIFTIAAMVANIALWWALVLIPPIAFGWTSRETFYALAGTAVCAAAISVIRAEWPGSTGMGTGSGHAAIPVGARASLGWITAIGVIMAGAILLAGVLAGEVKPLAAAMTLLLGGGALFTILAVADRLVAGAEVEVSSHWGGLGGSLGGWRISQTAILIVVALILVSATVALSGGLAEQDPANAQENVATDGEGEPDDPAGVNGAAAAENEAAGEDSGNASTNAAGNAVLNQVSAGGVG
ncbi:MAG TPA: hypothetical protein VIT45_18345 [Allosphingosinicella sp.]